MNHNRRSFIKKLIGLAVGGGVALVPGKKEESKHPTGFYIGSSQRNCGWAGPFPGPFPKNPKPGDKYLAPNGTVFRYMRVVSPKGDDGSHSS